MGLVLARMAIDHAAASEDELVDRLIAGEHDAWPAFIALVHPLVVMHCERRRYDRTVEDAARDVALRVIERLRAQDYAALRAYAAARASYASASFARWLGVLVHHAYVDHVRAQPDVQRERVAGGRRLVRSERAPLDDAQGAMQPRREVEILRIARHLEELPVANRHAFVLWLAGHSAGEIAQRLGLASDADANRLLHATRTRLRRLVHQGGR